MGRPPLHPKLKTVKTTLRLTQELYDRLAAIAGKHKVAEFFRDAAIEKADRIERLAKRKAKPSA